MNKRTKTVLALFLALMMAAVMCGCDDVSDTGDDFGQSEGNYTASGYEYRSSVSDGSANVKYLDATLDIEEGDEDTDFYKDSLVKAFVVQAVQDGEVIEYRSESEAESTEEANCWKLIDSGQSLRCEMYFPVGPDEPVTVQVLNPDGEDTVMAEVTYTP